LDDAIQTACAALLALHACTNALPLVPGEHDEVQQELRVAIELVRAAIEQLQLLPVVPAGLTAGFVGRRLPRP
jgi:hypothetical protein